jgi:hypothetical protein
MPADMDEGYPVESNRTVGPNEMGGLPYDNETASDEKLSAVGWEKREIFSCCCHHLSLHICTSHALPNASVNLAAIVGHVKIMQGPVFCLFLAVKVLAEHPTADNGGSCLAGRLLTGSRGIRR